MARGRKTPPKPNNETKLFPFMVIIAIITLVTLIITCALIISSNSDFIGMTAEDLAVILETLIEWLEQ